LVHDALDGGIPPGVLRSSNGLALPLTNMRRFVYSRGAHRPMGAVTCRGGVANAVDRRLEEAGRGVRVGIKSSRMTFNYQRYYELAAAEDAATFKRVLLQVAEEFGFPLVNVTVVSISPGGEPRERAMRNDPPSWAPYVLDAAASARDPCLALIRTSYAPFAYDQKLYVDGGAGDLWEEQAPFGFKTGISAFSHAKPGRLMCTIGMDRDEPLPKDRLELMRLLADLQLMVAFAQDTAFKLLLADQVDPQVIDLSARERDVLAWASQGKTAWETGMLLSISEHTVNKHLASAAKRLGCSSKAQAVAKAIARGLL
jgi:DNA-binding CsgD family transcriptional regulator